MVALGGLITCLKCREPNGWSIVISFLLVVTVLYSFVGTKLSGYVVPAFPFLCLLSAMAITEFSRRSKYAPVLHTRSNFRVWSSSMESIQV
jgi:hypothetical protein